MRHIATCYESNVEFELDFANQISFTSKYHNNYIMSHYTYTCPILISIQVVYRAKAYYDIMSAFYGGLLCREYKRTMTMSGHSL